MAQVMAEIQDKPMNRDEATDLAGQLVDYFDKVTIKTTDWPEEKGDWICVVRQNDAEITLTGARPDHESVVVFKCSTCGHVEEVDSINQTSFGSAYDFCSACGKSRDEDTDLIAVVGPLRKNFRTQHEMARQEQAAKEMATDFRKLKIEAKALTEVIRVRFDEASDLQDIETIQRQYKDLGRLLAKLNAAAPQQRTN